VIAELQLSVQRVFRFLITAESVRRRSQQVPKLGLPAGRGTGALRIFNEAGDNLTGPGELPIFDQPKSILRTGPRTHLTIGEEACRDQLDQEMHIDCLHTSAGASLSWNPV
jgi:hypothetical protein